MAIGNVLESLRRDAGLSIRELSAKICRHPLANGTLSFAYLSRLERSADHIDPEKITLDKLWAIGVVLGVHPLSLFVESHPNIDRCYCDPGARNELFSVKDTPSIPVGAFLSARRKELGLSLADVSKQAVLPPAYFGISPGFLSQVETDHRDQSGKVSGEKLWALGVTLSVDPLALFVASREVGHDLNLLQRRNKLFPRQKV
jgi:transcriptional regulator with XRE-family HTH domain